LVASLPPPLLLLLLLLAGAHISSAQTVCTVGPSGTYSTIQAGLIGCNGGSGDVQLKIQSGNYSEPGLFFPFGLYRARLTAVDLISIPIAPFYSQISVHLRGNNYVVPNNRTALVFEGLSIDGFGQDQPLFATPLVNNNVTLNTCLITNFTGNYSIRGEACARGVSITVIATRFQRVWGSAVSYKALEDSYWDDTILDKVGGYNNRSAVELKMSFVSRGSLVLTNISHWVTEDRQKKPCLFTPDHNGMLRCDNGTLLVRLQFAFLLLGIFLRNFSALFEKVVNMHSSLHPVAFFACGDNIGHDIWTIVILSINAI